MVLVTLLLTLGTGEELSYQYKTTAVLLEAAGNFHDLMTWKKNVIFGEKPRSFRSRSPSYERGTSPAKETARSKPSAELFEHDFHGSCDRVLPLAKEGYLAKGRQQEACLHSSRVPESGHLNGK